MSHTYKHFGSTLIVGRSGWGKTWKIQDILKQHKITDRESIVQLIPDDYKSWNRWEEETKTITVGGSVFLSLYGKIDTIIIEDIHDSFLWNSSVRMKFLQQVQKIAKHSNIIVSIDTFGQKVPKIWTDKKSWSQIVIMTPPTMIARQHFCSNHPILSKLNDSQISFILETVKDKSFRSLERVGRFLEQSDIKGVITFSILRQATMSVESVYLPPGLFHNAKQWINNPQIPRDELETMYDEDPFHFPYLIWNMLPRFCYHHYQSKSQMFDSYLKILDSLLGMDNTSHKFRLNEFCTMYYWFHRGWRVRESVVFQIPNIRNKISYSKVRSKLIQTIVETANIPPMFSLERIKQDKELRKTLPEQLLKKVA